MIVSVAPDGFTESVTLDPAALRTCGELINGELHAIVSDGAGSHQIWLQRGHEAFKAAIVVPLDDHFVQRVQTIQRLHRWLTGRPTGGMPRWQRISHYQLHRLGMMLRAWDGTEAGASRREVASVLLNKDVMSLRAIDWKNAPERRRINRILATARKLIDGGYLHLLRGERQRVHLFRPR